MAKLISHISRKKTKAGFFDFTVFSKSSSQGVEYLCLEIQALDTCGSAYKERRKLGLESESTAKEKNYGINWRMSAKTMLSQIVSKLYFLNLHNRKLVLSVQDVFFEKVFPKECLHDTFVNGDLIINSYHYEIVNDFSSLALIGRYYINLSDLQSIILDKCYDDCEDEILAKLLKEETR
ncbi:MAG: hypothetical protein LKF75_02940 [Bacilli bacterium]|jgi:hypothetical protein|nr:hypothetical protein [Bacilli bacterium]MCH4210645.1 hypothetical protein [Bacilli bacterium]MCH4228642.1 hypothetical protein [Bacilli bacterium]MCI2054730.1 hypothetical protein [Bacilli bacterium]